MIEQNIKAGAAIGGITADIVKLHDEGLIKVIEAVQCFDADSAKAMGKSPTITECDNNVYSNIFNKGCMVNKTDIGILSALEVDTDFNVNILTGSSGEMLGGLGGGPDVAAGAEVSIVTIPIMRGRTPSIVKRVFTLCTPGETVALVVTELGVSINPKHKNYEFLYENLSKTNIKIIPIEELQQMAEEITGTPKPIECTDKVVAIVEYRDGSVIDVIRQIRK
jgi:citrate lyase subunit alpha/citrate CoA-transferase